MAYHIDCSFLPAIWMVRLRHVEVATDKDRLHYSDHCPLPVDVALVRGCANSPEDSPISKSGGYGPGA
jgi:hypothetical protein